MEIRSDRRFRFDVPADRLWGALSEPSRFPDWWPWLRDFRADGLVEGDRWRCVVQPPLPYRLAFDLVIEEVAAPRLVVATVTGDLEGEARLDVVPRRAGCEVRLRSTLAPVRSLLARVAAMVPPVARFGHDWVLDTGARQVAEVLDRDGQGTHDAPP